MPKPSIHSSFGLSLECRSTLQIRWTQQRCWLGADQVAVGGLLLQIIWVVVLSSLTPVISMGCVYGKPLMIEDGRESPRGRPPALHPMLGPLQVMASVECRHQWIERQDYGDGAFFEAREASGH